MKKRGLKKKEHPSSNNANEQKVQKILLENTIALQKVIVNLSIKLDGLTNQMSRLLSLFEKTAESIAEREGIKPNPSKVKMRGERKELMMPQNKIENVNNERNQLTKRMSIEYEPLNQQPKNPPVQQRKPSQQQVSPQQNTNQKQPNMKESSTEENPEEESNNFSEFSNEPGLEQFLTQEEKNIQTNQ